MSMEDIELDVGGTKFKGVWLAILLSFASTIGGGIWAASEFFSRLEILEDTVAESLNNSETTNTRFDDFKEDFNNDKEKINIDIEGMKKELKDNNVAGLSAKLAELGTNLQTIMDRQKELLLLQEEVNEMEKTIAEFETSVQRAEFATKNADEINNRMKVIQQEIDDLWEGMDYLSNPYGN